MAEVPRSRLNFDAVGHYSRPDIFILTVDERPQSSVEFVCAGDHPLSARTWRRKQP